MSTFTSLPSDRLARVSGWAENAHAVSFVYRPSTIDGIQEVFALARKHGVYIALRGSGRSYGDAAMAREHIGLELTRLNRILGWNPEIGVIKAEAGVTIKQLWEHTIEDGWWPPVVPGTMHPTLGGALAMNLHGKNHFKVGTIGEHALAFDLLLPNGTLHTITPSTNPRLFYSVIGGLGVLGVIVSVTLQFTRVYSGLLSVQAYQARNWTELFGLAQQFGEPADQMVGWVDPFATEQSAGRGLVQVARFLQPGEDPHPARTLRVEAQRLGDEVFGVPKSVLWRGLRPWMNNRGMQFLSGVQYTLGGRKHGATHFETHAEWAFKLDFVPNWKRAYGEHGLVQYQVFVPKETAQETFAQLLDMCRRRGYPPYLTVFKRHRPDSFLLSYSGDGYSLALDFKLTGNNRVALWNLAADMDKIVIEAGGRFYFAKDSHLHPSRLVRFLNEERVQTFLALKRELDPENLLQTDLYQRIFRQLT